jgi:hypothetical protein
LRFAPSKPFAGFTVGSRCDDANVGGRCWAYRDAGFPL